MTDDTKSPTIPAVPEAIASLTKPIIGIENRTAQEVFDIMGDRIHSALPYLTLPAPADNGAQGVQVKPLEWRDSDGSGFVKEEAKCIIGFYRISQSQITGAWRWSLNAIDTPWSLALPTRELVKAAAQADYEARIRSVLIPPPAAAIAEPSEAEIEAALSSWYEGAWPPDARLYMRAALLAARRAQPVADRDAVLEEFGKHSGWSLGRVYEDEEEPYWAVHEVHGGRSDREWEEIGAGDTPLAAILTALKSKES